MAYINEPEKNGLLELVTPFEGRNITHAFHDIDGTHSLIRDWVPVMTLLTGYVSENGLPDEMVVDELCNSTVIPAERFPEAQRFSIESAGLSALTQMEWAIRNGIKNGVIKSPEVDLNVNDEIIQLIWSGEEVFDAFDESTELRQFIGTKSSELFRSYEKMLLRMSRDHNLGLARKNPEPWRVPGSMDFLAYLQQCGIKNYFVTGAVVERHDNGTYAGTMYEEVCALDYEIGPDCMVEDLQGSDWQEKLPKVEIMKRLCKKLRINPENVLIVGDGRSEIAAGTEIGAVTLSRLDATASRARDIHRQLKTNMIAESYDMNWVHRIISN